MSVTDARRGSALDIFLCVCVCQEVRCRLCGQEEKQSFVELMQVLLTRFSARKLTWKLGGDIERQCATHVEEEGTRLGICSHTTVRIDWARALVVVYPSDEMQITELSTGRYS